MSPHSSTRLEAVLLSAIAATLPCWPAAADPQTPAAVPQTAGGSKGPSNSAGGAQTTDGFHITPEILTATPSTSAGGSNASSDSSKSTLGLDCSGQKTWTFWKSELATIVGITPGQVASSNTRAFSGIGQIKGGGKIPADRNVNVGDTLDLTASFGPQFELNGDQRPFAGYTNLQGSGGFEYSELRSTRHYTYGVDVFAHFYSTPSTPNALRWLDVFDWTRPAGAADPSAAAPPRRQRG